MNVNVWTFVIVCPLIFLAGFVDSIAVSYTHLTLTTI